MKRLTGIVMLIIATIWLAGCTQVVRNPNLVEQAGVKGVFTEVTDSSAEAGRVDIIVRLSIKTHLRGYYLLESGRSLHGKAGYPLMLTIDGQTVTWKVDGQIETTPEYDAEGIRTPEGGEGRRYVFEKKLRLAPGSHHFEIYLPEETYSQTVDVILEERDKPYLLELKPGYRRSGNQRASFLNGLNRLETFLDGRAVISGKRINSSITQ